mgnify:CR=1 FL=1
MIVLRTFIESYIDLPDDDWKYISSFFKKRIIKKNELIISEGKICRHFHFLETGLVRHFILNDGNDTTTFFIPAPYCITSRLSFLNQSPTKENIQAIEKSVVWEISWKQYNNLMKLNSWSAFTRKILNEVQNITEERLFTNLTETAELRYQKLLTQQPQLINRIPLKHLASYLGIASQSLSRIRKKYAKG